MEMRMRNLLAVLGLVLAPLAHAGMIEDIAYFGITKDGREVELKYDFASFEKKLGDFFIGPKAYGFCKPSASKIQDEYFLYCSPSIGATPTVIYQSPPYTDPIKSTTALYKKAEQLCKRVESGCGPAKYYKCIKGCGPHVAELLVPISPDYGDE
jgi:hypothetical protein